MITDIFLTALYRLSTPESLGIILALALSTIFGRIAVSAYKNRDLAKLPLVNGKKWWQLTSKEQRTRFCTQAKYMIDDAFVNEFHINIDGFKPWREGRKSGIFQHAVQVNLTQDISALNIPLSEEATHALDKHLTNDSEWHEIPVKVVAFKIISQMSSRVFLGEELCRNEDWLQVTVDYTRDAVIAAQELRLWPKLLRPFAFRFANPRCKAIQEQLKKSEDLINPILEKRRRETEERKNAGLKPIRHYDAMQWMDDAANGRKYEAGAAQIMMAIAANFTGSDMLTGALICISQEPELVEDMRKEIITVMNECQWNKSTLYKLRLMDSVLKETQRIKPAAIAVMRRKAIKDTQLPDGTRIPKGTNMMVSTHKSWDSNTYENPEKFDGYRFLRKRNNEKLETAQFVSTTPESLGFGLGKFACPGRFFAANELKIVLSHIIMKYDMKLVPGTTTDTQFYSLFSMGNDNAKILFRRRQEEVAL
ncbi:hypothetical protein DL771_008463 [Monosporascus sp. 5C6A]|nr:hypothetical protein DL771_008463 [Monosporascus sp. 5C6A]